MYIYIMFAYFPFQLTISLRGLSNHPIALAKARELFTALAVVGVSAWMQRLKVCSFDGDGANGCIYVTKSTKIIPRKYVHNVWHCITCICIRVRVDWIGLARIGLGRWVATATSGRRTTQGARILAMSGAAGFGEFDLWWSDEWTLNGAFGRVFSPSPSSIWKISKLAGSVYDIYIYIYTMYIYIYRTYIYICDTYIYIYIYIYDGIYIYIYDTVHIYIWDIYICVIYDIYIYTYICVCDWQLIFKYWGRHKRWVSNIKPWQTANIASSSFYSFECRKLKLKLDSADSGATCREQPVFQEWSLSSHTAPCEPSLLMVKSWLPREVTCFHFVPWWIGRVKRPCCSSLIVIVRTWWQHLTS